MTVAFNQNDLRNVLDRLGDIDTKVLPKATRWALNDMAFEVLRENKELMRRVFDKPTPFTLNAFRVNKATLQDMTAVVDRREWQRSRHYLEVQNEGGRRPQTGIERLFKSRLKYSGLIHAVLPTKNIRRNRYGNVAPGTLQRILSSVQAQGDAAQNTTTASRARARGRRAEYFVPREDSRLSAGVYERTGKAIRKVLAFSEAVPSYSARFPMEEHAAKVSQKAAAPAFDRALQRALREL